MCPAPEHGTQARLWRAKSLQTKSGGHLKADPVKAADDSSVAGEILSKTVTLLNTIGILCEFV